MHVIFLQDYYPFLKGDKVEANTFCGRWRVSYVDEDNFFREHWVDVLKGKRIVKIINDTQNIPTLNIVSDDKNIETKNLKSGDKVWIELEVDIVHHEKQKFYISDGDGGFFAFSTSIIKKIIPKI